jgi:HK97 family phage portal protein
VQVNRFGGFSDYLLAGTKKVWASARAADIVANAILSTEMSLIWRDPEANDAGKTLKPDPELTRLLQNPNPYDTISEMLYLWTCHMVFTGNVFWFKDEMNGYGQPKNVYWLNPRFMAIIPDEKDRVKKYVYRVNGRQIEFTPDEIIHFRRPHANHALLGLGEIEQGESLFDEFINRALFNTRFMENGAMPSAVLFNEEFKGDAEQFAQLKKKFREEFSGVKNSGKVAWLTGKWGKLEMGLDASALQDLEKSKLNVEQIFLNHGVPLSVAGFGSANFATAKIEEINFRKYGVLPKLNLFTDTMNSPRGFIPAFNQDIRLDFSLSGLIDMREVVESHAPLFDRGGLTPNEFRKLCGLPKKKDPLMDQHFIAQNYVPIEIAGVASPTDAEVESASKPKPKKPSDEVSTNDGGGKKPAKEFRIAA